MTRDCNRKGSTAAVLALLAAMAAPEVASAEVVTLQQLEEVALQNRARWEAVEATTERAAAEVDAARAGLKPTFLLNAEGAIAPGSYVEQVQTTDGRVVNVRASPTVSESTAFRPNARYEATVAMRAPLYDGQNRASIEAAEANEAAAQASSTASRQELLANVRVAYLDWLAADLEQDLAAASTKDASAQRKRIEERVAGGDIPPPDLDVARYQELQAELAGADSEARLAHARRAVEAAVGIELAPDAEPDPELLSIDAADSDSADSSDWNVQALERERDAARQEAQMYRRSRVPVLAVVGQTGLAGINSYAFPMYRLGLNLAVPLWDGGRAVALAHAADARAIELDARARDAELAEQDEHTQAMLDRSHAEKQLVLVDALVSVSERRVEQAQASYDLGEGSLDNVADARASLRDAQSRRVQIRVARAEAVLRLKDNQASVAPNVLEQ
ncbi:MAG: TolC family protein [Polyangiales bacterium]